MDDTYHNAVEKVDDDDDEMVVEQAHWDDFPSTFTEAQPGFFPIAVKSLAAAVQQVPAFQPYLKEDKFKKLLRREADFR